ncbi:MAG: 16S rRNA (cytosine(967)-C(5))-methyltransferase RsmB [Firmicutes bacterium]|nr:16S rRNA (cytosine(967)-C(5))-methyltransferase RsmB [Bacillota bacterium]
MTKRPDFRQASASGRDLATEIVYTCDQDGAFAHAAWSRALSGRNLEPRERRLAMELAFGSIRRKNTLDWCMAKAAGRSVQDIDPLARSLLRIGAYQLLFMSRIPAHAAVSEAVESARRLGHRGMVGFINAVLRRIALPRFDPGFPDPVDEPVKSLAVTLSYPEWLVESWIGEFGPEVATRMLEAGNEAPSVVLRANTLRASRDELAEKLCGATREDADGNAGGGGSEGGNADANANAYANAGTATQPGLYAPEALRIIGPLESVESLPGFAEGLFSVQDESSMLVAHVLGRPRLVIDACAAPGGKATHIAELARDEARVVACDVSARRVALIRESARRLGLRSVEAIERDARELPAEWAGKADAVLVDAPCTGLGVLARRADARWRKEPGDVARLTRLQAEILSAAAACVAPGGVLVYSTCTVGRAENADQAETFLQNHPDFRPSPLAPHMPSDAARGLCDGDSYMLQLLPGISGTDGFFIARFVRRPT